MKKYILNLLENKFSKSTQVSRAKFERYREYISIEILLITIARPTQPNRFNPKYKTNIIVLIIALITFSCVEDMDHNAIDTSITNPDLEGKVELTFQELFDLHSNEIGKDTLVTGYVISSDIQGNTYKEIYVQNTTGASDIDENNPRMGLRIRLGLRSTGIKYVFGRKIAINLEGLKRTTTDNLISIGAPSNTYIKDILEFDVDEHVLKFDNIAEITPKTLEISELQDQDLNTLIRLENIQFSNSEFGKPLADLPTDDFDGKRTLETCHPFRKDTLILETSNFADFSSEQVLETQFNLTGIYNINFDNEPVVFLNTFDAIETTGVYDACNISTPDILITEIADPENASSSRYVELYNNEDEDIILNGWNLNRFNSVTSGINENNISLDGLIIPSKGFIIIANNSESTDSNKNFSDSFGFESDLLDNDLNGNGDDAYTLTKETGEIIDIFGVTTEDGSDSNWEYTDGRVYRNLDIETPNSTFTLDEWTIIKDGKEAPNSFSPKERKADEIAIVSTITTAPLLITEVADPDEDTQARFVEIYNPTNNEVSLDNWNLVRYNYTSAKNTKELAALTIALDGVTIPANGFVIVARNTTSFNTFFGETADIDSSSLDGNGDDAYELIDPFDTLIDVYGDATIDGTSSDWEYTDGAAKRKTTITNPNPTFDITEWDVQEDLIGSASYSPRMR